MKLRRTVHFNPLLFWVVPVVNVLFLLLVFHGLSTQFVLQPGISVTLPFSTFSLGPQRNPRVVTLTSIPSALVYYRDDRLTPEDFGKKLAQEKENDCTLIIKADRDTPYSMVVKVMTEALQNGYPVVLATSDSRQ